MLTIRQSLLSLLLISLHHTTAQEGSVKTICSPPASQEDPRLEYLKLIDRSGDFCTKLVDAKFADTTTGYRDPAMSISYTRSPTQASECSNLKKDDCLKNIKGLADICKLTKTFEYPTDLTTFLEGSSWHPTSCGTYRITVSPVVNPGKLGSNSTVSPPPSPASGTNGRAKDPNFTDNSGENVYESMYEDDGSGYSRSAGTRMGGSGLGLGIGLWVVVGLGVWIGC